MPPFLAYCTILVDLASLSEVMELFDLSLYRLDSGESLSSSHWSRLRLSAVSGRLLLG